MAIYHAHIAESLRLLSLVAGIALCIAPPAQAEAQRAAASGSVMIERPIGGGFGLETMQRIITAVFIATGDRPRRGAGVSAAGDAELLRMALSGDEAVSIGLNLPDEYAVGRYARRRFVLILAQFN